MPSRTLPLRVLVPMLACAAARAQDSFHGLSVSQGVTFEPNAKASFDVTKRVTLGIEYYGDLGPIAGFDPLREQVQAIFPSLDLNLGPNWEFNIAPGIGVTGATDHLLVKMILGHRFSRGRKQHPAG